MFWFRGSLVDGMRVCFLVSGTLSCWKESSSVIDVQRCGAVDRDRCGDNDDKIFLVPLSRPDSSPERSETEPLKNLENLVDSNK